jgi:hypothetical protein
MDFTLQFIFDNIRRIGILFAICGFFAYFVDYRSTKDKQEFKGERAFTKVASSVYLFGGVFAYVASVILSWVT